MSTESKKNQSSCSKAFILKDQKSSGNKGGTVNKINTGHLLLQG
jgi:hypothetical protein